VSLHGSALTQVAAGKRSHGQTRTVNFVAPAVVPERKVVEVAKLVLSRVQPSGPLFSAPHEPASFFVKTGP
jgi:hypothetical protein